MSHLISSLSFSLPFLSLHPPSLPLSHPRSPASLQATAWTAVYAPIIGILWVLLGMLLVALLVILRLCCADRYRAIFDKRPRGYSKLKLYIPLGISIFGCCMAV